jgi:hypothetical protein
MASIAAAHIAKPPRNDRLNGEGKSAARMFMRGVKRGIRNRPALKNEARRLQKRIGRATEIANR